MYIYMYIYIHIYIYPLRDYMRRLRPESCSTRSRAERECQRLRKQLEQLKQENQLLISQLENLQRQVQAFKKEAEEREAEARCFESSTPARPLLFFPIHPCKPCKEAPGVGAGVEDRLLGTHVGAPKAAPHFRVSV